MSLNWIAVDWGQTRQRAWAMHNGNVVAEAVNEQAAEVSPAALVGLISDWLGAEALPVVACGALAPARTEVPCAPLADGMWSMDLGDPRVALHVVPGLRQQSPTLDMMQGAETRVAGFLSLNKDWDGVICLPGAESRWVHVSAGEVVSFQTFLTGAMLGALGGQTVLGRWMRSAETDRDAFDEAVSDAMSRPERVFSRLFSVHAEATLDGLDPEIAQARILGGMIGAELAAARPFWLGQQLAVIGDGPLARLYLDALTAQGVPVAQADEARMTREGLVAAWRGLPQISG